MPRRTDLGEAVIRVLVRRGSPEVVRNVAITSRRIFPKAVFRAG